MKSFRPIRSFALAAALTSAVGFFCVSANCQGHPHRGGWGGGGRGPVYHRQGPYPVPAPRQGPYAAPGPRQNPYGAPAPRQYPAPAPVERREPQQNPQARPQGQQPVASANPAPIERRDGSNQTAQRPQGASGPH